MGKRFEVRGESWNPRASNASPPGKRCTHKTKQNPQGKRDLGAGPPRAAAAEGPAASGQRLGLAEEAAGSARPFALVFIHSKGRSAPSPWKQPTKAGAEL